MVSGFSTFLKKLKKVAAVGGFFQKILRPKYPTRVGKNFGPQNFSAAQNFKAAAKNF